VRPPNAAQYRMGKGAVGQCKTHPPPHAVLSMRARTNEALVSILSYARKRRKPRNLLQDIPRHQDIPQVPTPQVIQVTQEPQVQIQETVKHLDIKRATRASIEDRCVRTA